ncbi:MAG TPA: hypothetical protein H9851_03565 [Candidatus Borkfalkia faecavium]|uniref:Uncharacterized protein n=1 Tax=Candidatus Borkfalkia faecavium TaxID=2838508 RepID=A0A9D1W0Q9_9FIRM|nr:hypothetical protein [Candidatus Borkfalkia faecavium]
MRQLGGAFREAWFSNAQAFFQKLPHPQAKQVAPHAYYIHEKIFELTKIFSVSLKNTQPSALWAERPEFSSSRHIFKGTPLLNAANSPFLHKPHVCGNLGALFEKRGSRTRKHSFKSYRTRNRNR